MNIGLLLLIIIGGSVGALSTLYIVVSLIGTIAYKIFRTTKYHVSLFQLISDHCMETVLLMQACASAITLPCSLVQAAYRKHLQST